MKKGYLFLTISLSVLLSAQAKADDGARLNIG